MYFLCNIYMYKSETQDQNILVVVSKCKIYNCLVLGEIKCW